MTDAVVIINNLLFLKSNIGPIKPKFIGFFFEKQVSIVV